MINARSPVSYTHLDVYKRQGYIFVEMNPILPVKKKHTNANQVRDILMVIAPVYILKPFKMFVALAYDFLNQMAGILSAVPVGMDALSLIHILQPEAGFRRP